MKPLPSLRHLEYLAALDEHGHFGRAAAACGASQSAFSAGIAELEQQLGTRLAERDRRHVLVTATGKRLAARARTLLADARALVELAGADARPMSGEIVLGSIPTIAPFVMPRLLPAMRERFPDLDLLLREDKTPALLEQLAKGHLDLLLIAFPYETPGCETMMLFRDDYLFACNRNNPLAHAATVRSRDIGGELLMLLEPGHCLHSHALPVLETAGNAPKATFSGTSLQTLAAMVAVGMGSTLLPRLAVDAGLTHGSDVVTLPLGYEGGKRTVGLAWRRGSAQGDEFRQLGQAMCAWAEQSGVGESLARPRHKAQRRKA